MKSLTVRISENDVVVYNGTAHIRSAGGTWSGFIEQPWLDGPTIGSLRLEADDGRCGFIEIIKVGILGVEFEGRGPFVRAVR